MSKAVLMSIQPRWCELIANGKKTLEVRKTKPKLSTPFKVYIYCTNDFSCYATKKKNNKFWVGEPINNISKGRYLGIVILLRMIYQKQTFPTLKFSYTILQVILYHYKQEVRLNCGGVKNANL
ncbi:MAG: ASCH domain-containing protein [Candidatus Fimenecus sp.]